jgi:hypothetical protein
MSIMISITVMKQQMFQAGVLPGLKANQAGSWRENEEEKEGRTGRVKHRSQIA